MYQCSKRTCRNQKTSANLDEESFRKAIKDERAMELCFEYTRRFDLIRWGDYYKLMQEQVDKAQADESGNSCKTSEY